MIQIGDIISLVTLVSSIIGILLVAYYQNRNSQRRLKKLLNFHERSFVEETCSNFTEEEEYSIFMRGIYTNAQSKGPIHHLKA